MSTQHDPDPNRVIFPIPESAHAKRVSLSDVAFDNTSLSRREVAVEKAIITRKIMKVSAWDRVVSGVWCRGLDYVCGIPLLLSFF